MEILLTGGTGLLGRALCKVLLSQGHRLSVLSRHPEKVARLCGKEARALGSLDDWQASQHFDVVINLAGAPIIDLPWTKSRKRVIRNSRIGLTQALVAAIARAGSKPRVLLSGSAIGIYGDCGEQVHTDTEALRVGPDFGARLCADWETAAAQAQAYGLRVCCLRTGLVLTPDGGLLARLKWPFRLGLGGRLGSGQQWMSWIGIEDWINAVCFLLAHPDASGAFNLVAPTPVRNSTFTRRLSSAHGMPALLNQPACILRAALGQRAYLLLGGQRVLPGRLEAAGFHFRHPTLDAALKADNP